MTNIAFDIGATHMRIAALTKEGIGAIADAPTPPDPRQAVEEFARIAHRIVPLPGRAIGGVAAIVTEGILSAATNLPRWNGVDFGQALSERLGVSVILRNDAELAGLGEATYGAGKGAYGVAYLGLGTGVGTSRVVGGTVEAHSSDGAARNAIITLKDGSTLEERLGGHSLRERYGKPPAELPRKVWDALTPLLAEGIANALFAWSPDVLVLGGSLMDEDDGFRLEDVKQALTAAGATDVSRVKKAELGNASGLHGARALSRSV